MDITIRIATEADTEELLNIYAYYVVNTAITFEQEIPSLEEFAGRIRDILQNYPYLVAEAEGKIVGYAYASRFRVRASYGWSAATSIYIDKQLRRSGIGRKLYEELEAILTRQNVANVYAAIASPVEEDDYLTRNSEFFHRSAGYEIVARYHKCASKFGRWYDLIEMEKFLGDHECPPREFIPFCEL